MSAVLHSVCPGCFLLATCFDLSYVIVWADGVCERAGNFERSGTERGPQRIGAVQGEISREEC